MFFRKKTKTVQATNNFQFKIKLDLPSKSVVEASNPLISLGLDICGE